MKVSHFNLSFWLINVYGPTSTIYKKRLWDNLTNSLDSISEEKVIITGDFNATFLLDERRHSPTPKTMEYFVAFINNNALVNLESGKGKFTWTNKCKGLLQIAEKLDRFSVTPNWIPGNASFKSKILPLTSLDHFAMFISLVTSNTHISYKSSFKFEAMWFRHAHFLPLL